MSETITTRNVTRRRVLAWTTGLGAAYGLGLATRPFMTFVEEAPFRRAVDAVLPSKPISTGLDIGGPVAKLVKAGVIDREKFRKASARFGPTPEWLSRALDGKQQELILSAERAPYNLNLLWPFGLAAKTAFNEKSPIKGTDLPNFASTGGWYLGQANNGAAYFNAVETVTLTPGQSDLVLRLSEGVFRPCCGNSTFFQDCNHGSAMLGLLELAAANGRSSADILKLAKSANGFWYPQEYVELALYFDTSKGLPWGEAPPDQVLSAKFSSIQGWRENVHAALIRSGTIVKRQQNGRGSGCAV